MVVIPFFYDQFSNSEIVEQKGIGVTLDRDNLTPELIQAAVEEVIGNPLYRQNILRLKAAIQDEPMQPRDKVAWWLEYAIRNREEVQQMHYKGAEMPFYQTYFIDVGCIVFTAAALVVTTLRLCYFYVKSYITTKLALMKNKQKSL